MKTAGEIIKSLECCTLGSAAYCADCSYRPMTVGLTCLLRLKEDALDLILRLTGKSDGAAILEKDMVVQKPSPAPETHDAVNHPDHYTQGGVECIDALKAATTGLEGIEAVCTANAIKYLWRWKQKNGTEDLRKAVWYIDRLIGETEG